VWAGLKACTTPDRKTLSYPRAEVRMNTDEGALVAEADASMFVAA
jgi:hypothetical protein